MVAFKLTQFSGQTPRVPKEDLPNSYAQTAQNVLFDTGDLIPYKRSSVVEYAGDNVGSIYPYIYKGITTWLKFSNTNIKVTKSSVNDQYNRIYYTGDGKPKVSGKFNADVLSSWHNGGGLAAAYGIFLSDNKRINSAVNSSGAVEEAFSNTFTTIPAGKVLYLETTLTSNSGNTPYVELIDSSNVAVTNTVHLVAGDNNAVLTTTGDAVRLRIYNTNAGNWSCTSVTLEDPTLDDELKTYDLGIPKPTVTPVATLGGGGAGTPFARAYTYTLVSEWGEEGKPADATNIVNAMEGQTVIISNMQTTNPLGQHINKKRVYRTLSGETGTEYYFLDEIDISVSTYTDTHASSDLTEQMASLNYDMPPEDMQGLISLPNGILVGFSEKEICFSEPYIPYAYPNKYRISVIDTVIGLACTGGTSFVICTDSFPYRCSGNTPDAMTIVRETTALPCVSALSIQDVGAGAIYATTKGLVLSVSSSGSKLITDKIYDKASFEELTPSSFISGLYNNKYFASGSFGSLLFDIDDPNYVAFTDDRFVCTHHIKETDELYFVQDGYIRQFHSDPTFHKIYTWRSRKFRTPNFVNIGAARIIADFVSGMASNQNQIYIDNQAMFPYVGGCLAEDEFDYLEFNGSYLKQPVYENYIVFRFYVNDALIFTKYVTDTKIFRLPSGYRGDNFYFEVESNLRIREIHIGETPLSLQQEQQIGERYGK